MIECKRDKDGRIQAVCEWMLFNQEGKFDDNGETMFIGELEINPELRGNGNIKYFMRKLYAKAPQTKKVFWFREYKYPGRGHRFFDIDKIKRRMGE